MSKKQQKSAVITGILGQDASYLSEILLEKGYRVVGMKRRTSLLNSSERVDHVFDNPNFIMEYGNMTDSTSIYRILQKYKPDEVYNLAAQSHVKVSFDCPEETLEVVGHGVLKLLEACRAVVPNAKIYQASSSEMYGDNPVYPQNELTQFMPASPYACSKVFAHNLCRNYRHSYNMFISCGILFNHECFSYDTPIIIKKNEEIDIIYVSSLVPNRKNISKDSTSFSKSFENENYEIWDGNKFVKLKTVSRKKLYNLQNEKDKKLQLLNSPKSSIITTPNHKIIKTDSIVKTSDELNHGDDLILGNFPKIESNKTMTEDFSMFLGLLVGDGYVSDKNITLSNNDEKIQNLFVELAQKIFCNVKINKKSYKSGFNGNSTNIDLSGISGNQCKSIRELIYDLKTKHKKVPQIILNSNKDMQLSFLRGYYFADGLKKDNCVYEFKSFKTNSPLLAQGLLYIINNIIEVGYNINSFIQRNKLYYQINIHSPNSNNKGKHKLKNPASIKKKIITSEKNQHVFDIETETGVVMAGIGQAIVGNSPRRGETFVTRKISMAAAKIKLGYQDNFSLGNLDAKRDWGHAKDYCEGMWLMLQQQHPDDFVLATGETHTVREYMEETFNLAGLDPYKYLIIDDRLKRPHEVPLLLGDFSKAKKVLNWEPKIKFKDLVKIMYESEYSCRTL